MAINRRQFTNSLLATFLLPLNTAFGESRTASILSCASDDKGHHYLASLNANSGELNFLHPLPARGHGVTAHQVTNQLAIFARRPDKYIHILDLESGKLTDEIAAAPERHFYGHGVFTKDGRYLLASINDYKNARGLIGRYDTQSNFALIDEIPTNNIGPHELAMMPDGKTIVVANGGIRTHPDKGREKLNLKSMRPSLTYINWQTGQVLEEVFLDQQHHQSSIRHLAVHPDGRVCFAMQHQQGNPDALPLVGLHKRLEKPQLLEAPFPQDEQMAGYCGSVTFSKGGQYAAISHPRGNLLTFWNMATAEFAGSQKLPDGCGLYRSADGAGFIASSGHGGLFTINADTLKRRQIGRNIPKKLKWDNHILLI